jgi:alanyl-tRNA synthetase
MSDSLRERIKSGIIVFVTVSEDKPSFLAVVTQDLVATGFNAGNIVREVAKVTGGGGGGKPTMAQAGGRDKTKIDEALQLVKKLVAQQGK